MTKKTILRRKKVRLEDVARVAQISAGTASMAIAGSSRISAATRKRVLDACRTLDYQRPRTSQRAHEKIDKTDKTDKTSHIGLLCIGATVGNPDNNYLFHYMTTLTHQCQARLEVVSIEYAPAQKIMDQVLPFVQRCDGLLLTGIVSAKLMRLLHEAGIRAGSMDLPVQDDPDHADEPCPGVFFGTDDRAMAAQATQVLLERGHRHIAFLTPALGPGQSQHRLYEGHCLAMINAGHAPDRQMLGVIGRHRDAQRQLVQRLNNLKHPPTAAIVLDVVLANPLIYEMQAADLQIDPKDIFLWATPESAVLHGLSDSLLMCIDVKRWAEAGLRYALSSPETRIPSGTHVCVPFNVKQCPPPEPILASTHQTQSIFQINTTLK